MLTYRKGLAALAVVAVLPIAACGSSDDTSTSGGGSTGGSGGGEALNVGAVLSLSGPAASFGTLDRDGINLAVKSINDAGGVNGKPVKVTIVDDQSTPDKAVIAANKLITKDRVDAVIGATTGSATLAMAPIFNRAKVPLLAPVTTVTVTEPKTDYVFRTAVNDTDAVKAVLAKVSDLVGPGGKVALIYQDDASGQAGAALYKKEAAAAGIDIVESQQVATDASDVQPQLLKIRDAKPDAILIQTSSATGPLAVKQARQLGMDMPIIGTPGLARATTWVVAGDAAAGALIPTQIDPTAPTADQEAFVKQFQAAYPSRSPDKDPTLWDVIAYDALSLIGQAVKNANGDTSPEAIKTGLEKIQGYKGAGGEIGFSQSDHDGLGPDAIRWVVVKDDRLQTPPDDVQNTTTSK
jgi:branched-chain amino acid transport system substrate-binding protein